MRKYFTVWFSKNSETVYTDEEFNTKNEAIKHAEKYLDKYEDAMIFRVTETDNRKSYRMVESFFNNK